MQLIRVDISKYRRFAGVASFSVDGDVVALVGPNEAGKSSVLDALEHLNASEAFQPGEIARDEQPADEEYLVEAVFVLDQEDLEAIADIPESVGQTKISFVKRADGGVRLRWLSGRPERDAAMRSKAGKHLRRAVKSPFLRDRTYDSGEPVADWFEALAQFLDDSPLEMEETDRERLQGAADHIEALLSDEAPAYIRSLPGLLGDIVDDATRPEPGQEIASRLFRRQPQFLKFDAGARTLPSRFDLENLEAGVPRGLRNLASLATLDLRQLATHIRNGRRGEVQEMQEAANQRLADAFEGAWSQGRVSVSFNVEGTVLEIYIREGTGSFWEVDDRSDGLRWFVALIAMLATEARTVPPILLIDEADRHLHYDAQADLVRTFHTQSEAAAVIYTTHSAGCLPQDLGSAVKVVKRTGPHTSTIRNGFWVQDSGTPDEAGFSSVLMEMGATTFAFSAARYALVCEGRTELVLLPSLMREACGVRALPFQVVPGLASISPYAVPALDLAAARVLFLVDNDRAGRAIRRKLIRAGVSDTRVLSLSMDANVSTVEDLLDPGRHREAVIETYRKSNIGDVPPVALFREPRRSRAIDDWCSGRTPSTPKPDKVAVAHHLVSLSRQGASLCDARRLRELQRLSSEIYRLFGLDAPKQ